MAVKLAKLKVEKDERNVEKEALKLRKEEEKKKLKEAKENGLLLNNSMVIKQDEPETKLEDVAMKNEEPVDAFDTTNVHAVRRAITNVYSKGTYNPSAENDIKLNMGRSRGHRMNALKYDEVMENEENGNSRIADQMNEDGKGSFDDRYIIVYYRKENAIGFVFYDISILHFYVGSFTDPKTNVGEFRTLV